MKEQPPAELVEEYFLFKAARILGIPPWELMDQSVYWIKRVLFYERLTNEITEASRKN